MRDKQDRRLKLYRGVWCVVWREYGKTCRASLRTKDRAQAERNFQEYLRQVKGQAGTVSDIMSLWFEEKKNLKSIDAARYKSRPILEFFGNYLPHQIDRPMCRKYRAWREVGNTTVRNELAILRSAINWFDPHNKAVFEFPPTDQPRDHYLNAEEYGRLLKACRSFHIEMFIVTALHTAARATAILELEWKQIDFERRLVNLAKGDHKNKRRALVPINDVLYGYLMKAYEGRTCDHVIEFGGRKISSVRKAFGETAKKAGVTASPHVLRHTAAVVMAEAGIPLPEISQYLGHTGRTTTERVYAKYSPGFLRNAAQALNDWHLKAEGSN